MKMNHMNIKVQDRIRTEIKNRIMAMVAEATRGLLKAVAWKRGLRQEKYRYIGTIDVVTGPQDRRRTSNHG